MQHSIEPMEKRLLFSAGLEGALAIDALHTAMAATSHEPIQYVNMDEPAASETRQYANISQELVIVDTNTPDYQELVNDLVGNQDGSRHISVVLLDNSSDGIRQVTEILGKFENLDTVHIISHASDGSINLGSSSLNNSTLDANADLISNWGASFSETGDLLIYGCNLAASGTGQALVDTLARLTSADTTASVDLTGNIDAGGDWDLEYASGPIESTVALSAPMQSSFNGLLMSETVREEFNTSTYNNNDGTTNWSGGWTEAGEPTDPANGTIQVVNGQLQITTDTLGTEVRRELNLSGATWATLSLDRNNQLVSSSRVAVEISSDGGSSWTSLFEYRKTVGSATGSDSYDISPYIAAHTQLRFVVTKAIQASQIYFDNIEISFGDSLNPVINSIGIPLSYTENDPATVIDNSLTVLDSDSADFEGGVLTVDLNGTGTDNDRLAIENQGFLPGQVGIINNQVYYSNTLAGSFTGGTSGTQPLSVTFNANATVQTVQAVMRAVTFENISDNPETTARTVHFAVTDGDGGVSNTSITSVNIISVNDEPGGTDGTITTIEDTAYSLSPGDFGFTDLLDSNNFLDIRITSLPAAGSLSNNGTAVFAGDYISAADVGTGLLVYTPPADANGTGVASFSFLVRDDGGTANGGDDNDDTPNTITINITPSADAINDTLTTSEDSPGALNVLSNDTFSSGATITAVTQGSHGSVTFLANGTLTYSPVADFNGSDTFTYTVTTASGNTESATVTVNVTAVNDAAAINGDTGRTIQEDVNATTGYITASGYLSVSDIDTNESGFVPSTQSGQFGTYTIDSAGHWTYQALNNQPGIQAIGAGQSVSEKFSASSIDGTLQNITITINGTDDGSIVSGVTSGDIARGLPGQIATTSGQISISDIDSSDNPAFNDVPATMGSNGHGSFVLENGNWTYTLNQATVLHLNAGDSATDSIKYTATDGTTQKIVINITSSISSIPNTGTGTDSGTGSAAGTSRPDNNATSSPENATHGKQAVLSIEIKDFTVRQPEFEHKQSTIRSLNEIQAGLSGQHVKYTVLPAEYHYGDSDDIRTDDGFISRSLRTIEQLLDKTSDFSAEILQLYDLMKINISETNQPASSLIARALPGIMLTLSAGVVTWTVRSGGLLATMLTSIPVWKGFDPVPLIEATRKQREDEGISPEGMIYNEQVDGIFDENFTSATVDPADGTTRL